ncbi:MAG TPA: hypothetical protein PLQ97_15175, partial [Myxococcota bacterium]|nr:hypothetical protein [Myxococcota bacterium]
MTDGYKDIKKLEADLWDSADDLRANSRLRFSDYFMPAMGIIFLRHAANRFDEATLRIEADKAAWLMPNRKVPPGTTSSGVFCRRTTAGRRRPFPDRGDALPGRHA